MRNSCRVCLAIMVDDDLVNKSLRGRASAVSTEWSVFINLSNSYPCPFLETAERIE